MAYNELEQITYDLDLFLRDKQKMIHIASGGGKIPERLANLDSEIEEFSSIFNDLEEFSEIEINPNLIEILNFDSEREIENYLADFLAKARKGFYTYDKTNIGNFDDMTFHLVAKPSNSLEFIKYDKLLNTESTLPETFETFDLSNFI
jgi:hypothetical protein